MPTIYKICPIDLWRQAIAEGQFRGSPADLADGFIHFSTAEQVKETAARHFAGVDSLLLIAFDEAALGPGLRYERSRGGALFPHLYATLDPRLARATYTLPLGAAGHRFPELSA